jgi:hypothetical protein
MEEWEAFKAKAEAGCSKHDGDGPCECGARDEKADQSIEDIADEDIGEFAVPDTSPDQDVTLYAAEDEQHPRRRRGRGRGHGQSRHSGRPKQTRKRHSKKDHADQ